MAAPKKPRSPRKPHTHLPALSKPAMTLFAQQLAALPTVSSEGKRAVLESMTAAMNPNAESPLVVIKTLEREEQLRIMQASLDYQRTLGGMNARGRAALMGMSDEEWDAKLRGDA